MKKTISITGLIACMCEGGAETAIMDILLDNDLLIFNREQLIGEEVIPRMPGKVFQNQYLRMEYDQKITILRVIDSRNENFKLSTAYQCQVDVIDVITAPEIEMLIIVSMGKYKDYCKSGIKKPSEYCIRELKIKNVKDQDFVSNYFADPYFLVQSIKDYNRVHKQKPGEASLYDLLK